MACGIDEKPGNRRRPACVCVTSGRTLLIVFYSLNAAFHSVGLMMNVFINIRIIITR
jgi:hypothetical protein